MDTFLTILAMIAALLLAFGFLGALCYWLLNRPADQAAQREEQFWNKQLGKTKKRLDLLDRARQTGDYTAYNVQRASDNAEFDRDVADLAAQETVMDERTQYELANGINPYKNVRDNRVPAGKLAKNRR